MNPTLRSKDGRIVGECVYVPKLDVKGPERPLPVLKPMKSTLSGEARYSLFRQHPTRGWMRFTSISLPWEEAIATWGDVTPEGIQIRPIAA